MKLKHTISSIGILALVSAGIIGVSQLPAPEKFRPAPATSPLMEAADGTMNFVCTGNLEHLLDSEADSGTPGDTDSASATANSGNTDETSEENGSETTDDTAKNADIALNTAPEQKQFTAGILFPVNTSSEKRNTDTSTRSDSSQTMADSTGIIWKDALLLNKNSNNDSASQETQNPLAVTLLKKGTAVFTQNKAKDQKDFRGSFTLSRGKIQIGALAASNTHYAETGDLRGLATNPCVWATDSAWFVGLQSGVGYANQLRLVNPSANPILVEIDAFNSLGRAQAGANAGVAIAPGQFKTLSLDGILDPDERVALHLHSNTGMFGAVIESTALSGLTPQGVDFVKAGKSGNTLIIPGLYLPPAESETDNEGKPPVDLGDFTAPEKLPAGQEEISDAELKTLSEKQFRNQASQLAASNFNAFLRIVNPGTATRTVNVYTLREGEVPQPLTGGQELQIAPETVFDLNLDGLKSGAYTLQLIADGEIAAGVQSIFADPEKGIDFSWLATQNPLNSGAASFIPADAKLIISAFTSGTDPQNRELTQPINLLWKAFDQNGKLLDSAQIQLQQNSVSEVPQNSQTDFSGLSVREDLPENTAFVEVHADKPVYAGVSLRMPLTAQGVLIDWIPLTAGIDEVMKVSINLYN